MNERDIFYRNVTKLIDESGKSQREIAHDLGISPQLLNTWIIGRNLPRMERMEKLANYFKVTVADLLREETEKPVLIKTDAEILMDKIKLLNRDQITHLSAYIDFLTERNEKK